MKRILLFMFLTLSAVEGFMISAAAQTDLTIKIVDNTGAPINGLTATNIKFRIYPYGSGNELTGISVVQENSNTLGIYHCSGFTTFQLAQLWINGTQYKDFGNKFTGDPGLTFATLGGTNTWTSSNSFNSTLTLNGHSTFTYFSPLIGSSSTEYTTNTPAYGNSLVWRGYVTALMGNYLPLSIIDASGLSTVKLHRSPLNTPLFDANATQFYFNSTNGLNLMQMIDTLAFSRMIISEMDSTDGSDNSLSKILSVGRAIYTGADSLSWYYTYWRKFNGSVISTEKFAMINRCDILDEQNEVIKLNGSYQTVWSGTITPGYWDIRIEYEASFEPASNSTSSCMDSITTRLRLSPNIDKSFCTIKCAYPASVYAGSRQKCTISVQLKLTTAATLTFSALCSQDASSGSVDRDIRYHKVIQTLIY